MPDLLARRAGSWKRATPYIRRSAVWATPDEVWAKRSGIWVRVWPRQIDLSWISPNNLNGAGSSHTFTDKPIGAEPPAGSLRLVIVAFGSSGGTTTPIIFSDVTIGGIAATEMAQQGHAASNYGATAFFGAYVPTGTQATITVTLSRSADRCWCNVYRAIDASIVPLATVGSTADPGALSLQEKKGGAVIGISQISFQSGAAAWTGLTKDVETAATDAMSLGSALSATTGLRAVSVDFTQSNTARPRPSLAISLESV